MSALPSLSQLVNGETAIAEYLDAHYLVSIEDLSH